MSSVSTTIIVNTRNFKGRGDGFVPPIACLVAPSDIHDEPFCLKRISNIMLQQHPKTFHKKIKLQISRTNIVSLSKKTISCLCDRRRRYTERCQGHGSLGITENGGPAAARRTSYFTVFFLLTRNQFDGLNMVL